MANNHLASTLGRYMNLFRKSVEVAVVLLLALITTILYVSFGWVTLLFKPASDNFASQQASVAFSAAAKPSKDF
jgi:hypothetical protein